MVARPFSDEAGRARLARAVKAVERNSSAEIVLAVRASADAYPEAGWRAGAALGFGALVYMLYAPQVFELPWMAAIAAASVATGVIATGSLASLRRRLTTSRRREAMVTRAAKAAFVDLGTHVTRGRTGILVYVALSEAEVAVIADAAVHAKIPAEQWARASRTIERSLRASGSTPAGLESLATAIEALAGVLVEPFPRAADDTDELEDVA